MVALSVAGNKMLLQVARFAGGSVSQGYKIPEMGKNEALILFLLQAMDSSECNPRYL